jgi:hypothetical protein
MDLDRVDVAVAHMDNLPFSTNSMTMPIIATRFFVGCS